MSAATPAMIETWLKSIGKAANTTGPVRDRIVLLGEFIMNEGKMPAAKVAEIVSGFDLSKPVQVLTLPPGVYVHYEQGAMGRWFTTTGLMQDDVGLATGFRTRKLYYPAGSVRAVKGTARSIRDTWSADKLFKFAELDKQWDVLQAKFNAMGKQLTIQHRDLLKKRIGELTRGGGTQYWVADPGTMKEVTS